MGRKSKSATDAQKRWEDRIARAKAVKKTWKDLFRVQMALDYFDGKQRPPEYPANEWLTINKLYTHLKAQLPALYSADPYFYVKVKRSFTPLKAAIENYERRGKIRAAYLNYLKDELNLKEKARMSVQDAMFAFGVMAAEHVSTMVENPDAGNPIPKEEGSEEPMLGDDGKPLVEPEVIPVESCYGIRRVHPDDFLFDEDAGPLEDSWVWVAERMRVPYDEVDANPLFKKSAVKALKGKAAELDDEDRERERRKKGDLADGLTGGLGTSAFDEGEAGKPKEVCTLWKIFDLKKKRWLIIAEGGDEPLLPEDTLPPGVERHPYAVLRFTYRDDSPYPIPPMSQGLDASKEYNMARSDLLRHRKRFNRKYQAFVPGLTGEEELGKLETGDDGTIIKCTQPGSVITPITDAPLDQMRYQELQALNMDMVELFGGTSDEARGIASADSATQAGILDNRLQLKEGDALSMVVDMIKTLARKLDQLVQAHFDAVEVVRITGLSGDMVEIVRPQDYAEINGEFQYDVNVGSTMPRLPQMERSSWMAFLQLIANAPFLGASRRLLTRMAELHHIDDELMVEELGKALGMMAQMMAAGKQGQQGSLPNTTESNPAAAVGGQAGGVQGGAPQMPGGGV
jgi:hypothetical protein